MGWYVDGEALYEQTAEWEAAARKQFRKLNSKPLKEMSTDEIAEWRKWSCILNERSAFKHDVAEAHVVDAVVVVRCKNCKYLSDDRIAPEWNRICRLIGVGKSDNGFCDEAVQSNTTNSHNALKLEGGALYGCSVH